MTKTDIGERLRYLREKHGLTQRELAGILGLGNASTVGSWEIGKSEPSLTLFSKLCGIYGIDAVKHAFPDEFGFPSPIRSAARDSVDIFDDDTIEFAKFYFNLDSGDRREAKGFVRALLTKPQYKSKTNAEFAKEFDA